MKLPFPGINVLISPAALVLTSREPLVVLSSAVVGGGLGHARYIINLHVDKDYASSYPAQDLAHFASQQGIEETFIGMLTAAYVQNTRLAVCSAPNASAGGLMAAALVTAGLGNATSAGISQPALESEPDAQPPGTINMILLINARLSPAALVNAVITATEAKSAVLRELDKRTPLGEPATGTSTDSVVVACAPRLPGIDTPAELCYAGPGTLVGWLIACSVRRALTEALV